MAGVIELEIVSPVKTVFNGQVNSITAPGTMGEFQVLFNHAPLVSTLETGRLKIETSAGEEKLYAIGGGIFEVHENKASILAESIESKEEIDEDRVRSIKEEAENTLNRTDATADEKLKAKKQLQSAENKLKVIR